MDCKTEKTVRTFLRIEAIILQGICHAVFMAILSFVLIPVTPFVIVAIRWRLTRGKQRWLPRVFSIPLWFVSGVLFAVCNPWFLFARSAGAVIAVVRIEWATRWETGKPKKPDGHPMEVRTEEERELLDWAVAMSVVRDYNDEALENGQGIEFEDADE